MSVASEDGRTSDNDSQSIGKDGVSHRGMQSVASENSNEEKRIETIESIDLNDSAKDGARQHGGLGIWATAFFILGEVAGAGALSLPNAVMGTGYMGIILLIMFCVMAGYAATKLGVCWTLLEERYPEYRKEIRQPFQMIGFVCYGNWMRWFVTVLIQISLLGASVVFILLLAGMLQQMFYYTWNASICYWTPIVAGCLVPLTWFGTPKDFWFLGMGASASVYVASILLTAQAIVDSNSGLLPPVYYPNPTFKSFSLSFGAILFAYGGTTGFPTIQNDMKDRKKFTKAAIIGFIGILVVYIPVTCSGYFVYGNLVQSNIALTVSEGPVRTTAQILLILHLICAFQVVINPSFQDFEEYLHLKSGFSLRRCVMRTVLMGIILFVCESVPDFSKIQDLIGGSTNTLLTFVLPPIFYIKLISMKGEGWKKRAVPLEVHTFLWEVIVIGVLGGIASTVSAVMELASPDALSLPCYVQLAPKLDHY